MLEDLVGHQLLQEVAVDGVARLCPAARGGPLERDKAERTITCLDTQGRCHSGDTAPKKWGWRAKGCRCTRSRVPVLAQSSGEGEHMQTLVVSPLLLGQAPVTPREAPRIGSCPILPRQWERTPFPIPSHLLVSQ